MEIIRCDVCGKSFGPEDDFIAEEFNSDAVEGLENQVVLDAIADALEEIGECGKDYEMARIIRECGEHLSYGLLRRITVRNVVP